MRTIPDYSEWETLTLYFYRFLVRNSTNSYLSYYQIHKIYKNYFFTRFTQFDTRKKIRLLSKKVYTLIFQTRQRIIEKKTINVFIYAIRIVYQRVIQRVQINKSCLLGGMSHSCADNRNRDIMIACSGSPTMAGSI